jgi:hypothetical protein
MTLTYMPLRGRKPREIDIYTDAGQSLLKILVRNVSNAKLLEWMAILNAKPYQQQTDVARAKYAVGQEMCIRSIATPT